MPSKINEPVLLLYAQPSLSVLHQLLEEHFIFDCCNVICKLSRAFGEPVLKTFSPFDDCAEFVGVEDALVDEGLELGKHTLHQLPHNVSHSISISCEAPDVHCEQRLLTSVGGARGGGV